MPSIWRLIPGGSTLHKEPGGKAVATSAAMLSRPRREMGIEYELAAEKERSEKMIEMCIAESETKGEERDDVECCAVEAEVRVVEL